MVDHIAWLFTVSVGMLGVVAGFVLGIAYKVRVDRDSDADRRYAGYVPPARRE